MTLKSNPAIHPKKLLILHTGGTFGMSPDGAPSSPEVFLKNLTTYVPQIFEMAHIEVDILLNKDSSNIQPADWVLMARHLDSLMEQGIYDGIVITHGTDTMAFSASVLSYMLSNPPIPIFLTGSQRPLADHRSDAARNLIHSVELAVEGKIREVCVFFDSHLFRGNRTKKISIPSFRAFESPNFPPLVKVGVTTEYASGVAPAFASSRYVFDPRIETRVLTLKLHPGLDTSLLLGILAKGLRGLVIQAFGPGDIPSDDGGLVPFIQGLTEKGVPTVICSQAVYGSVDLSLYETGRAALQAGAISAADMTWEAAITKMMILLGRGTGLANFRTQFPASMAGEISERVTPHEK